MSEMNFWALESEEEEAAAVTWWRMSCVPRVVGSMRRSLVKVLAIPPVAV
jgi:xanthosine utilization system XapX-like protein